MSFDHDTSVAGVRAYFDAFGDGEWARLDASPAARASLEVHRRFLARFIEPGMRVLEVGAGPGRFTQALVAMGAIVLVTDLSPVQLDLNRRRSTAAAIGGAIEGWEVADVCDLRRYEGAGFDAVVAFGGPLSYAFGAAPEAMAGMLRIGQGPVVASVMSTLGAYRSLLPDVVSIIETHGDEVNDRIIATGDLRELQPPGQGHSCRMFRWSEVAALVEGAGGRVVGASASNWASLGEPSAVERLAADPERWERFLDHEVALAAEPGALDGGTHILFAAVG